MLIKVLGASGGEAPGHQLTGFRLGQDLLLDAGTIGARLPLAAQRQVKHVLLTHGHLDHIHALPFLLDNLIGRIDGAVQVYGLASVLDSLRANLFNGLVWPNFTQLPTPEHPVVDLVPIEPGRPFAAGAWQVEAVSVDHSVPGVGYLISQGKKTVCFTGDTAATHALWDRLRDLKGLAAIFAECSFPKRLQDFALKTKHLSLADIPGELAKTGRWGKVPVYLYHLKPEYATEIARQAQAYRTQKLKLARAGQTVKL